MRGGAALPFLAVPGWFAAASARAIGPRHRLPGGLPRQIGRAAAGRTAARRSAKRRPGRWRVVMVPIASSSGSTRAAASFR